MAASIIPITGTTEGGEDFTIIDGSFDMSACSDDFNDGSIGGLWNQINSGSGVNTEIADRLRLDTGLTSGSVAGVRTVATINDMDVVIDVRSVTDFTTLPLDRVTLVTLGLFVNTTTKFLVQLCRDVTFFCLRIFVQSAGTTLLDSILTTSVLNRELRLVRVNNIVKVLIGGQLIVELPWTNEAANVEISAENNTQSYRVVSDIFDYSRQPMVIFGDNPSLDVKVITTTRVRGSVPEKGNNEPGLVDITLRDCSTTEVLVDGYNYTLPENLLIVTQSVIQRTPVSRGTLTKVDDLTQRNRILGLPGQRLKAT